MIVYVSFAMIQAINNDIIYCDSSIDQFDGKIMYTFNEFVSFYNQKAIEMQNSQLGLTTMQQEQQVKNFNQEYQMICKYNTTKWMKEPIIQRIETTWYGFKKILMKTS